MAFSLVTVKRLCMHDEVAYKNFDILYRNINTVMNQLSMDFKMAEDKPTFVASLGSAPRFFQKFDDSVENPF
jgi:hypothetical protein